MTSFVDDGEEKREREDLLTYNLIIPRRVKRSDEKINFFFQFRTCGRVPFAAIADHYLFKAFQYTRQLLAAKSVRSISKHKINKQNACSSLLAMQLNINEQLDSPKFSSLFIMHQRLIVIKGVS